MAYCQRDRLALPWQRFQSPADDTYGLIRAIGGTAQVPSSSSLTMNPGRTLVDSEAEALTDADIEILVANLRTARLEWASEFGSHWRSQEKLLLTRMPDGSWGHP